MSIVGVNLKIEIMNGQKIDVEPIAKGRTNLGTRILVGKVIWSGAYVMWNQNTANKKHPFWMYRTTGTMEDLLKIFRNITT